MTNVVTDAERRRIVPAAHRPGHAGDMGDSLRR